MGSYWHCVRAGEHLSNKWTWNNDKIWDEQGFFGTEVFSTSRGVYVQFYYQNDVITDTRSVAGRAGIWLKPHSALIQWGKYPFKPNHNGVKCFSKLKNGAEWPCSTLEEEEKRQPFLAVILTSENGHCSISAKSSVCLCTWPSVKETACQGCCRHVGGCLHMWAVVLCVAPLTASLAGARWVSQAWNLWVWWCVLNSPWLIAVM